MAEPPDQPPFFEATEPRVWTPHRLYRVYVLPRELLFLWAGYTPVAGYGATTSGPFTPGALGRFQAEVAVECQRRKNWERQEKLDRYRPEELIDDHRHNFRAAAGEVEGASLDPPSFWLGVLYRLPAHAGVFRFRHPARGRVRLAVWLLEDMGEAVTHLPQVLGDRLAVNVTWDRHTKRFVPRR